jgi:cholesterol transport system auxiliary component
MKLVLRLTTPLAAALLAAGCSIGGLLGGGEKPPPTLLTLTPEAAPPGEFTRAASAGQAITIRTPEISNELRTNRVPAYVSYSDVAYIQNLQWVDTPNRVFRELLAETVRRMSNRIVLDPGQTALDPGVQISGELHRFGYDAQSGMVIVRYDASLATAGGTRVETRRFEATAPADGTAGTVGPALNRASNQVALEFAQWIAG